jgi:hypothetical protein
MERLGFTISGYHESYEGWAFENDTFRMQPYYWGDCDCGYDQLEWKWSEEHRHADDCYQTKRRKIIDEHGFEWVEGSPTGKLIEGLCVEMGLSYPESSAVHCTCSHRGEWEVWSAENGHKDHCSLLQPNFLFKPTSFRLDWYKYPLRDSYSSELLTAAMIDEMFAECERSMR